MIWKHKKAARKRICVLLLCKSKSAEVLECANERHRNDFIKYITPWWFENNLLTRCVSCSVRSPVSRPSPKLASSRLRQRLFGAAASQTSRRKPCYRQSDCFRIHHGCIILRTMFYNAVRLHIAKSSWPVSECLSEKLSQAKIQNIKKQK